MIIRYRTQSGQAYLQATGLHYHDALAEWHRLDDLRRDGLLPWVRHFEVRSSDESGNPTVKVPTRPARGDDPADALRLKSVKLAVDQRVYTWQCTRCGKAIQGSGLGVGSHRRVC